MKTKSEGLFERFLATNNLSFEKIEADNTPRPDYRVSVSGGEIIFELKELAEDGPFGVIKDLTFPHSELPGVLRRAAHRRLNRPPNRALDVSSELGQARIDHRFQSRGSTGSLSNARTPNTHS
ncbi:MAG TPA: hypothetical protein VGI45_19610 [Terracidiphilus sp.]|jgi:hypothetical protein